MKTLTLTDAQHIALDNFADTRATLDNREARFLHACLIDLGGNPQQPWRYDKIAKCFYLPEPPQPDGDNPPQS